MQPENGYRVPEVQRVVGISYRQLDYWARTGLVRPSIRDAGGSGTQRLYSFQDIVELRLIKRLLDEGVALQRIRRAIDFVREHLKESPHRVTLASDGAGGVYAVESPEQIIDLVNRGQGVLGFVISVDTVWKDLEGSLKAAERPAAGAGGG